MAQIVYVPAPGYSANMFGVVSIGEGTAFDVHAQLAANGGQITVDSVLSPNIVNALDSFPGLIRSGVTPGTPVTTDAVRPLQFHSSKVNPGDTLTMGPDGVAVGSPTSGMMLSGGIPRIDYCGHSIPGGGGSANGDINAFPAKLSRMLGARKHANIAKGGSVSCWPTASAQGDGGWSWILNMFTPWDAGQPEGSYTPRTNLLVIMNHNNDIAEVGPATTKPSMEALKTAISRYCSSVLYEDTHATWAFTGGSWVVGSNNAAYSGTNVHYTQTLNQTATWTCPSDYPGNLVIAIGLAVAPGAVGAGASLTLGLTIDGVARPDIVLNLDKNGHADAENGKSNGIVIRVGRADCGQRIQLGPGSHTIALTNKAASAGAYFTVDYAQIEADPLDGPVVAVIGAIRTFDYSIWNAYPHGPNAATDPVNDAGIAAWNAAVKATTLEFPGRIVYVDADAALAKNGAYFSADHAHPNNLGHSVIAATAADAIAASGLLTTRVRSRISFRPLGAYDGGVWCPMAGDFGVAVGVGFLNGWVNFPGGAFDPCSFTRDLDNRVRVRGAVQQPSTGVGSNTMINTLPKQVGYYPARQNHDRIAEVYNGATFGFGNLRADASQGMFMMANGSNAAGNASFLDMEWTADGGF